MTTALVTGATSGIGYEFARQLAAESMDLVLVARSRARLEAVAERLAAEFGVFTEIIAADLTDRAQTARVALRLADRTRPVDMLVNNAGGGLDEPFLAHSVEAEEAMFDLMGRAVLTLSHAAAGSMRHRGKGVILNVSSMRSYLTVGTYSATKVWVRYFSEALAAELAGTGVTCTVVCPGFTRTPIHAMSGTPAPHVPRLMWLKPAAVARHALVDAARGRVVSIPGVQYRVMAAVLGSLPSLVVRRVSAATSKRRDEPAPVSAED